MRRRVELRHRLDALDATELHALQDRLLRRAVELTRPGGIIVYSTCSIEPDENEERVRALLAERDDVSLEEQRASLPAVGGGDGGYVARLRKATE
jgi:16S rRNA (cytosine967-C5)-methyltransferase